MRVKDLTRLLKSFDDDAEVRVAACLEDPQTFGGSSHDLPIAGLSSDFDPGSSISLKTLAGQSVVWLVTSYLLAPQTSAPRKKAGKRTYQVAP